jgi:hypothetical protein
MCFSATVSFTAAATLVPVGAYCLIASRNAGAGWMAFASYPILFGLQQVIEGIVWRGIEAGNQIQIEMAARSFAFFSHFFWLFWVPFSVWLLETEPNRKKILAFLTAFGFCYGLSIFIPLFREGWLSVEVVRNSLDYRATMIYDGVVDRIIIRIAYALQVVTAFMLSTNQRVRLFGVLILLSVIAAFISYKYAFVSVWCFFASLLSLYMVYMVRDVGVLKSVKVVPGS